MTKSSSPEQLAGLVEALLFTEGGELSRKKICSLLSCSEADLTGAFDRLKEKLSGSGLTLIVSDTEAVLAVSREESPVLEEALKRELDKDIGDAGLEVLAIVLYLGPSTRARIDYIRGVNTASTLRTLLSRGLVERIANPEDAREYLYRPTVQLLGHLGVGNTNELPDYATITSELAAFEAKSGPFEKNEDPE